METTAEQTTEQQPELQPLTERIDLNDFDRMRQRRTIWDQVQTTDPDQVKPIVGKDYKGSSPKPYWIIRRLTEIFGPIGIGWGFRIIAERFEKMSDDETLHVAQVGLWYCWGDKRSDEIVQMGQTKAKYLTKDKVIKVDEDAPKKSVTDALVKCASYLGFAGDIFMGLWDDSKYQDKARDYWADGQPRQRRPSGSATTSPPPDNRQSPPSGSRPPANRQSPPTGRAKASVPKEVTEEMIAKVSLALEVAKRVEDALERAREVFVWKLHNLISLPIANTIGRTAIQRVGQLVKAETFDKYRQLMEAYVGQEIVTAEDAEVMYQLVRTELNIVDGKVPNFRKRENGGTN